MGYDEFEQKVLALAYETKVQLTAATVAYQLGCPAREAGKHLRRMLDGNILILDSDDAGNLVYDLPGRADQGRSPMPQPRTARSNVLPRVLNGLLPGSGSLMAGRLLPGFAQIGLSLSAVVLLMMFWKDFGDTEHKPWLFLLLTTYVGAWLWAFKTVTPDDDS